MRHSTLAHTVCSALLAATNFAGHPMQLLASEEGVTRRSDQVIDLPVTVLDCTQAPVGHEIGQFYASGALPVGCEPTAGVLVSVEEDGDLVTGNPFTTDEAGHFSVQVAVGSEVVVIEDPSTDPRGYEPLIGQVDGISYANPLRLDPVTEGDQWGLLFVNVPADSLSPTAASTAEDANARVVRALYEQVYSQGNLALIDELFAPNFVEHQADFPPGPEGVRSVVIALRAGFPDLQVAIEDITAQEDKVWVLATMRGTQQGEVFGIPATGRTVEVRWFDIYQLADGKIIAHWGVGDELGLMEQLGFTLVPPETK